MSCCPRLALDQEPGGDEAADKDSRDGPCAGELGGLGRAGDVASPVALADLVGEVEGNGSESEENSTAMKLKIQFSGGCGVGNSCLGSGWVAWATAAALAASSLGDQAPLLSILSGWAQQPTIRYGPLKRPRPSPNCSEPQGRRLAWSRTASGSSTQSLPPATQPASSPASSGPYGTGNRLGHGSDVNVLGREVSPRLGVTLSAGLDGSPIHPVESSSY